MENYEVAAVPFYVILRCLISPPFITPAYLILRPVTIWHSAQKITMGNNELSHLTSLAFPIGVKRTLRPSLSYKPNFSTHQLVTIFQTLIPLSPIFR